MLILSLRTDKPEAEIGLYNDTEQLDYLTWAADRQLAETIHLKINDLLKTNNWGLEDLGGLVVFAGPGSFTGLRIGISVANTLAYSLNIPIVASRGETWQPTGLGNLAANNNDKLVVPEYGSEARTTKQLK